MNQIVDSFRQSQDVLFSALDGHDSDAIFRASQNLGKVAAQLGAINAAELEPSLRPLLSEADELMQASIYRLRFLRDHSSTRLQLLAGWRESQANTYSGAANGR
jgi:hypothetical protein